MDPFKRAELIEKAQHHLMSVTAFKFTLIKIRSKISYSAFEKNMTILELIVR